LVGLEGTVSDHVMHKTSIQFLEGEKKRKKEKVLEGEKVIFLLVFGGIQEKTSSRSTLIVLSIIR